jgi:hypothetical protein
LDSAISLQFTSKYVFDKKFGFEFLGFFIKTYYKLVGFRRKLIFSVKPSLESIKGILVGIKNILRRFNKLSVVIIRIRLAIYA